MAQSLARLHFHVVFSTRERQPFLHERVRATLHAYIAKVLQNLGCRPVLINSVEDHVHILVDLARTVSVSQVLEDIKKSSSKWIKSQGVEFAGFAWQGGYGAFAVSESQIDAVHAYFANQRQHHGNVAFQDEYRILLRDESVDYNEQYLWD